MTAPFARPWIVERRALLERLEAHAAVPLVCIVAPAGFGKSMLLRQWTERGAGRGGWVSLADDDNDPVVLLHHLVTALDRLVPIAPEVIERLATAEPSAGPIVRGLGAAFAASPQRVTLVIDVGPGDLALDAGEAAALLRAIGVELPPSDLGVLVDATEGWPVAVYLAGRAIQARGTAAGVDLAHIGRGRDIVAYTHAELLSTLTDDQVEFLTRSSVLRRMSGPLCDAVLETAGSAAMLEDLAESNQLVIPLDGHREWYRYHHLFGDLLRAELERREPSALQQLNRRAAQWCERHGELEAAVEYAMAAGDVDRVARIAGERTLATYRAGRVATLRRWFDWLDRDGQLSRYPRVAVGAAWLAALTGNAARADRCADAAEHPDPAALGEVGELGGELALMRAMLCRDGVAAALGDPDVAERTLSHQNPWWVIAR